MPQYWLKPLGTSEPPDYVGDDWIPDLGFDPFDPFELTAGPASLKDPPKMGRGDNVLLHAAGESRVFAQGEILGKAHHDPNRLGGDRWPWAYPFRIEAWVPRVSDGPKTSDFAKKPVGRIQWGTAYVDLTRAEYAALLDALTARPTFQLRPESEAPEIADAHAAVEALSKGRGFSVRLSADERRTIELRAMRVAETHYASQGFVVEDVSAKRPYDLLCTRGSGRDLSAKRGAM